MSFYKEGSLVPYGGPVLRREIIANSQTVTAGDCTKIDTDGFVIPATAAAGVFGHVMSIATNKGVGLNTTGATGAEMGSYVGTFATASDNETVAMVRAEIDISQMTLYKADPATGTFGTTTAGSDQLDTYFDLSDEESIDETSVADTAAQYHSFGKVTGENRIVVNIFESTVFNTV